jgi:hypothetical protein
MKAMQAPASIPIALLISLTAGPGFSQGVDPKIHKLCIEAKDYAGCVKVMTTNPTSEQGSTSTIRVVEGERELTGNSCPANHAYSGAGWCTNVICEWYQGGNEPGLGGKRWKCNKIMFETPDLRWGNQTVKATYDSACPKAPPEIGWQSSCEQRDGGSK